MTRPATELHGRHTTGFEDRRAEACALLLKAAKEHAGAIVQASSLGAEDMVVTDLIVDLKLDIPVATLDTGMLHGETLALIDRLESHYQRRMLRLHPPAAQVLHFVSQHGDRAMFQSVDLRRACCAVRKVEPLQRLLQGRSAWVTGLRREQSDGRAGLPAEQADDAGRIKFSPLADWSWHDVWHYIASQQVPYNALHDQFFPSIGCAPCTRAVALGEDARAGRWWWEADGGRECGLHTTSKATEIRA